ncbi:MAG: ATP-dependent zinc metalloprotease FtsH [Thermodesulfobacteriota bacterium]
MTSNDKMPVQKSPNWIRVIWVLLIGILVLNIFRMLAPADLLKLPYSDFKKKVSEGQVSQITIKGDKLSGSFKEPISQGSKSEGSHEEAARYERFETVLPSFEDPELIGLLEENGVTIKAKSEEKSWVWTLLVSFLPWLLLIGFFVYTSKKFQERAGGGGGLFGFGKSKAKVFTKATIDITYEEVAGLSNTKKELQEVVDFLKDPSKYMALGGQLPKGILLVGPPGTGKTLMARATAGEANVPFFSISGSEFIEMFVGVGASRVRDMFKQAKKEAPSIIFVDELDSIGRVRGTGLGGGHDEREQTLNQILAEMDGFSPHESVVVMAATNRPDVLDPALIRPGRFDRRVTLELPQKNTRKEILEVHTRNVPLSNDVDLESLASRTAGFSGADIKNLVNEAALLAARKEKKQVEPEDFDQGRDKILMGIEREDVIKDEDKKIIAYHEAGHALMARLLPSADPLEKVSIIPRGRSLGSTEQIPEEDRRNLSRQYLLDRIAIMLGGRASERLFSQDVSTGTGDDLKQATELARRMVCQWGMSEKLGPITFRQGENHPFLGREIGEQRDFSEESARIIDEEIRRIIRDMEKKAEDMLKSNRDTLDKIAKQLLVKETLSNDDIDRLLTQDHDSSRE